MDADRYDYPPVALVGNRGIVFIAGISIPLLSVGLVAFAATATFAAFHVVVADRACRLFHAGLQFADAVADAEAEALPGVAIVAVLHKVHIFQVRGITLVLLEEVAGIGR